MNAENTISLPSSGESTPVTATCALKEWAATCLALAQGRQIVLLRKGGLLDEDGVFHLEQRQFFLSPTWLHQDATLVKPEHRDLLALAVPSPGESRTRVLLRLFATVERVWALGPENEAALQHLPHIWSQNYLDLRYSYQTEAPLLCVALRVWELEEPQRLDLRPMDLGCRSWMEWPEPRGGLARPVMAHDDFQTRLELMETLMG